MKKSLKICLATLSVAAMVMTGCSKDDTEYGKEIGTVEGKIEFTGEEPEIILSNIKSYVGEEIDFLSGIDIGNIDEDKDMETWVDASLVDIFTPGDYKATYTIKYDGKEYMKDIVVTIIEKENSGENSADSDEKNQETTFTSQNNSQNNNSQQNGTNPSESSGQQSTSNPPNGNGQQSASNTPNGNGQQSASNAPNGNGQQNTSNPQNTPNGSGQPSTTKSQNSTASTTRRQIVTSSGNETTEYKELGYYSIELLSGKTVKLKSTTSKYIVSTHTDISYVTKNDSKYKVSKLIVYFNDGTNRVLETVEEKLKWKSKSKKYIKSNDNTNLIWYNPMMLWSKLRRNKLKWVYK